MSHEIEGMRSRRILTAMTAVFAVVVMLAVPMFAAVDTDADFTKESAGYCVRLDDPTDLQMAKVPTSKSFLIRTALEPELEIFNQLIFVDPVVEVGAFTAVIASGEKVDADKTTYLQDMEVEAKNVKITYTAKSAGSPVSSSSDEKNKQAAEAIKAVFGETVAKDDKLVITGDMKIKGAKQVDSECTLLDGGKYVYSKETTAAYVVYDIDMTVKLVKTNSTEKTISMFSDLRGVSTNEYTYEYESSPIVAGTEKFAGSGWV